MLTLLAATILSQTAPDTSLRLLPGDQWTAIYTYEFEGEDIELTNVESVQYAVVKEAGKPVLEAKWKLVESKVDGEIAPAPKGIKPVVLKVALNGDFQSEWINEDVQRFRIERVLQVERKGNLSEPLFFPPPPTVRPVGIEKQVGLAPNSKVVFALNAFETGGDKPIKAVGHYTFEATSGILESGKWTINNCPIPGGVSNCDLMVTLKVKDLKLMPRK